MLCEEACDAGAGWYGTAAGIQPVKVQIFSEINYWRKHEVSHQDGDEMRANTPVASVSTAPGTQT